MSDLTITELKKLCKEKGIKGYSGKNKAELVKLCFEGKGKAVKRERESILEDLKSTKIELPKQGKKKQRKKTSPKTTIGPISPEKLLIKITKPKDAPIKVKVVDKKRSRECKPDDLECKIEVEELPKSPEKKKLKATASPKYEKDVDEESSSSEESSSEESSSLEFVEEDSDTLESSDEEKEKKGKWQRKAHHKQPTPYVKWDKDQKRWIDDDVSNFLYGSILRSHEQNKQRKMMPGSSKSTINDLWGYEPWSKRTQDAWNNGWINFKKLIELSEQLKFKNALERLKYQQGMTKRKKWVQSVLFG